MLHSIRPLVLAGLALCAAPASAHVTLLAPNGLQVLDPGTVVTIDWTVAISHNLQNWDIWYSTTGSSGPWIAIATNLPPGSGVVGSPHSWDWSVPNTPATDVYIRIRMDNSATDYFDTNDQQLIISDGTLPDCNNNGQHDVFDIVLGSSKDFDGNGEPDECQPLSVDTLQVGLNAGGTQNLILDAGAGQAGALYFLLGSLSGTSPGLPVDGQLLPLNPDAYFSFTLTNPNSALLANSLNFLSPTGTGSAAFTLPGGSPFSLLGTTVQHAYVLISGSTVSFASNAMPVLIVF